MNSTKIILIILMISQKKVFTFHSLETQVAISKFLEENFSVVHNQSYSYPTSFDELIEISKNCIDETILCAAGTDSNNAILMLVSCGNCRSILTETYLDRPNLINGAYWYLTPYYSFGFSPSLNIRQYTSDRFDCGVQTYTGSENSVPCRDTKRLSWSLSGSGGFRLGIHNVKDDSIELDVFRKIIMLK